VSDTDMSARDIHTFFELSYAQYLSIPRSVLQSMPQEWQVKFVALLDELDETIDWRPPYPQQYRVTLHEPRVDADPWEREELTEEEYWGPVLDDPLMDYRRGRRHIAHRGE
jgi:hypothetical protein